MRKILMLVVMVVMAVVAMAQSTNKISYQAVVRDGQNRLVTNSNVTVLVKIGTTYQETFSVTTNANGLLSLQIPTDAHQTDFDAINWATANTITTTVTIVSTSESMTNTVPMTSVPYALYANNVNPTVIDTLVSKNELAAAIDTLVTDTELAAAIDTLVTDNELLAAIDTLVSDNELAAAIDTLVTDVELAAAIDTLVSDNELAAAIDTLVTDTELAAAIDTLVTDTELAAAIDTLVTDTELAAAIDTLVTDAELAAAIDTLVTDAELAAAIDTLVTDAELAAAIDTLVTERELADTLDYYYTKIGVDTLLAAKADTSDIHDATVTFYKPDNTELTSFTLNTENNQEVHLPGNPLTLKFVYGSDTIFGYNSLVDQTSDMRVTNHEYLVIDVSGISTQGIVKYINASDASDVDSIYNALRANGDVKDEIMQKVKTVAMNHEQDAIDILLYYFENISTTQMRNVLDEVTADTALVVRNFLTKLNSVLTPNDVKVIIRALSQSITEAQVENLIDALNRYVTPAQVDHFIDALDNAAATPGSAAAQLKERLTNYIDARIDAKIQQHVIDRH